MPRVPAHVWAARRDAPGVRRQDHICPSPAGARRTPPNWRGGAAAYTGRSPQLIPNVSYTASGRSPYTPKVWAAPRTPHGIPYRHRTQYRRPGGTPWCRPSPAYPGACTTRSRRAPSPVSFRCAGPPHTSPVCGSGSPTTISPHRMCSETPPVRGDTVMVTGTGSSSGRGAGHKGGDAPQVCGRCAGGDPHPRQPRLAAGDVRHTPGVSREGAPASDAPPPAKRKRGRWRQTSVPASHAYTLKHLFILA